MQLLRFILVERRQENGSIQFHIHEDFGKFLRIEKDQIMNSWAHGVAESSDSQKTAEQYYNETYNK